MHGATIKIKLKSSLNKSDKFLSWQKDKWCFQRTKQE